MGTAAIGVAGAAIGATAAVILSKKENRDKIVETVRDLQQKGEQLSERLSEQAEELKDEANNRLDSASKKLESKTAEVKKSARSQSQSK